MLLGCHTPVFCIAEIPEATLDYCLQCIEKDLGIDGSMISDEVAFITSKDVYAITSGATRPAKAFISPFLGESVRQVNDWFLANIRYIDDGFTAYSFLIMDAQTVQDNTCLVVCNLDDEVETVRCDFDVGQMQIRSLEFGCDGMRNGCRDLFMDTGEVMTKELHDLCIKGRLRLEDGKLKEVSGQKPSRRR